MESKAPLLRRGVWGEVIMKEERKPNIRRGEMAFIFSIVLGLALGIMIKKIRVGILIGIILGIIILLTGWLRAKRK